MPGVQIRDRDIAGFAQLRVPFVLCLLMLQIHREPRDLVNHTLLHLEWNPNHSTWPSWADWLKAAGAGEIEATRGVYFNQMSMAIVAAAQGQGVALTSFAIAADGLASGRLVAPFEISMCTPFGYYFLCRPADADTPRIKALRDFLVEEAALSAG